MNIFLLAQTDGSVGNRLFGSADSFLENRTEGSAKPIIRSDTRWKVPATIVFFFIFFFLNCHLKYNTLKEVKLGLQLNFVPLGFAAVHFHSGEYQLTLCTEMGKRPLSTFY